MYFTQLKWIAESGMTNKIVKLARHYRILSVIDWMKKIFLLMLNVCFENFAKIKPSFLFRFSVFVVFSNGHVQRNLTIYNSNKRKGVFICKFWQKKFSNSSYDRYNSWCFTFQKIQKQNQVLILLKNYKKMLWRLTFFVSIVIQSTVVELNLKILFTQMDHLDSIFFFCQRNRPTICPKKCSN